MKQINLISILFLVSFSVFGQEKLIKDLDFDGIDDSVYYDENSYTVICKLSTQKFKPIVNDLIETYGNGIYVTDAKNGFYINISWMRSGISSQFRYNKKTKKMQLIGMSRYEFGNAANDGSGESSVNLLTGDYIGDLNFYDHLANNEEGELIKIPTIKTKMKFIEINLEDFSDGTFFDFSDRCSTLYYKEKERILKEQEHNINEE